jgi:hypothetical protein
MQLTAATPDDDYPENLVAVAQRFFRWLCEQENERLAMRRFTTKELEIDIENHAEWTGAYSGSLNRSYEANVFVDRFYFRRFCEQENVDQEEFMEPQTALDILLLKAHLQHHLAYYDLRSGEPNPKFRFPMFEEAWALSRSANTPSDGPTQSEVRRPPGRPGIDYGWMENRLAELEQAGDLPPLEGPWRTDIASLIRDQYMEQFDGKKPSRPPKIETIRDGMRIAFDELEDRDEELYGTR